MDNKQRVAKHGPKCKRYPAKCQKTIARVTPKWNNRYISTFWTFAQTLARMHIP